MSKKHIYQNGTKVEIRWEGATVGKGIITNHEIEDDEDNTKKHHILYEVKIERTDFERFLGLEEKQWLNSFEVRPIK